MPSSPRLRIALVAGIVIAVFAGVAAAASAFYADRITARTAIGSVPVGNLSPEDAALRVQEHIDRLERDGVAVRIGDYYEVVLPESVGFDLNIQQALDLAMERGHRGSRWQQVTERLGALWARNVIPAPVAMDETLLADRVEEFGQLSDVARKDLRLLIQGRSVTLLTDTQPGKAIDHEAARAMLAGQFGALSGGPVVVPLVDDEPRATMESARQAEVSARRILERPVYLNFDRFSFAVTADVLGSWMENEYEGDRLVVGFSNRRISEYVTRIADQLAIPPEAAEVTTEGGLITGFIPPKYGRSVREDELVERIVGLLERRAEGGVEDTVFIPVGQAVPPAVSIGPDSGITELIGKATTPFTGSPRNRISNITNGTRFLSGQVVHPGEEFSTLGALGTIDNTTGYLPELVIKGDRTVPEFGGGLCQVSTTLFRAALDAGLPITARRNHSFRVGYYEKDGDGRFIGPGLDATIYEPDLDMKFRNDTPGAVLVIGYVHGDRVTFELYGTKDGRSAEIEGPVTLTEVPAGDPIYIETDELAPGETRQVEWPHPGGSAVATYRVTYADGHTEVQEFKSWYRKWPAQFLVGAASSAASTPAPTPFPVTPPLP
ncbi:MAG TPA: VanW family protein [Candidatus Paceibacterota bacterium]|nr:VanW family protein [Candidatus Paceibacterota bacterium]